MKQNKKMVYVLIPAVILVWGMIIYKILKVTDGSSKAYKPAAVKAIEGPANALDETYHLVLNYRDPFFGKQANAPTTTLSTKPKVSSGNLNNAANDMTDRDMPNEFASRITYHGIIDNPGQGSRVGLMTYQGKRVLVRKDDNIDGFRVLDVKPGQILVSFDNKKFLIVKSIGNDLPDEQSGNNLPPNQ
jgi:hypothetical protein